MISKIFRKAKELLRSVSGTNESIEQRLKTKLNMSAEMAKAIQLWGDMYQNKAPWLKEPDDKDPSRITSLGLPAFIASEKARMCTLEMKSEITGIMKTVEETDETTGLSVNKNIPTGNTARAEYLNKQYQNTIITDIRTQLEYGIAKGGLVIKPYVIVGENGQDSKIAMDYIQADNFYPIAFDANGNIIEAVFIEKLTDAEYTYYRLEYHKLDRTVVTVINKAFKTTNIGNKQAFSRNLFDLGHEIPLTDISEWAAFVPEISIENVDRPLFAYFRVPIANTIDTHSPLGASAYSNAKDLIKDADKQYSRLLWEFEGSELAIDIDSAAFTTERSKNGNDTAILPKLQKRLFRKLDIVQKNNEDLYSVFSPQIRDQNLLNGLNNILMRIEDVCELARGTLSDVNQEAKTATEIIVLKQRSYAANAQMQKALENTLRNVVYIMNVYADLYRLAPDGEYDVSFEWDDSIQTDKESEMSKRMLLLNNGVMSKIEFRMWYFGETEEQAMQALNKVQEYNNYEMQSSLKAQSDSLPEIREEF